MIHKNSQKRIYLENKEYFITTNTYKRYPYFKSKILCELFILQLEYCKEIYDFDLYGFVIIYDHVHFLIRSYDEKKDFSKIMFSIKKNFSMNANKILGYINFKNDKEGVQSIRSNEGAQSLGRKDIDDGAQAIARVRNNVPIPNEKINDFIIKYKMENHNIPKFKWHKSFHDHYIRDEKDFNNHLKYINLNPIKHNMPDKWKYVGYNYPNLLTQ